jgi:hypothetical protein
MSLAFSMVERLHHQLRLAISPSYRGIRKRLEEIRAGSS